MVSNLEKMKQIDKDLCALIRSCNGEPKPISLVLEVLLRNTVMLLSLTIAQGKILDCTADSDKLLKSICDEITDNVNHLVDKMTEPKAAGVKFDA